MNGGVGAHSLIWVRGAGEIGSAAAISLHHAGFHVFLSEINPPLAIRRSVTFSDAIIDGQATVTGITAQLRTAEQCVFREKPDHLPLLHDDPESLLPLNPRIIIDARMIKSYDEDYRSWADNYIGFGPGFIAGENCHAVIETMRGHDLGKIITAGSARKNTGIPGNIGGESKRRVIYAPAAGALKWHVNFGSIVETSQPLGTIDDAVKIRAPFRGMVRGLIHPSVPLTVGMKIADVDPRGAGIDFTSLSDKARSLGRAALEAVMIYYVNNP